MKWARASIWLSVIAAGLLAVSPLMAQDGGLQSSWQQLALEPLGSQGPANYSSWIEIAAHLPGAKGCEWRTDVVVYNELTEEVWVEIVLHTKRGEEGFLSWINGGEQMLFEDVIGFVGYPVKGPLEIRSVEPVAVIGKTYNWSAAGTVGQLLRGYTCDEGLAAGESAVLLGLSQTSGGFRTNICITNTGVEPAVVWLSLYEGDGFRLMSYPVSVDPGMAVHEVQPFRFRRGRKNVTCGFAKVEVEYGSGILASASVIDSRTNDAVTVPMMR